MIKLNYIAVDDEAFFLKELSSQLKAYPYLHEQALIDDPFEAIGTINRLKPDIVFLDHDMPGIDGRDVLKAINYKANVVFVSSNSGPMQQVINHDGIALIKGYLSKPFSDEELKKICLKLLSNTEKLAPSSKISIPNGKKEDIFIDLKSLSFIKANEKYTDWHFTDRKPIIEINISLKESKELLKDKNIDFNDVNRSYIVFENGIIKRRNKDIFALSNNKEIEIGIKDTATFSSWIKNIFR